MNLSNYTYPHTGFSTFIFCALAGLTFSTPDAFAQNDVAIGQYYRLNLQRQTDNADAYIFHNAKVDAAASAVFRWETTHPSFGSRGIVFSYFNGIQFFADAIPTTAGTSFTPTPRFVIRNDGNVGIGTSLPRGKFDIDGPGDIYLVDDPVAGTGQSLFVPGHIYLSPYGGGETSYLQARRPDNSGTTSLRFRTCYNGSLTESMHISGGGSVGIGTIQPDGLQVGVSLGSETSRGVNNIRLGVFDNTPRIILDNNGYAPFEIDNNAGRFRIYTPGTERFTMTSEGNVGIGTSDPGGFKLAVEGKIGAREVTVMNTSPWPDYVFRRDYPLPDLLQLEEFIYVHRHLPEIPSGKEVEERGINLGQFNMLLLKKVEELTLHLIEKEKEMNALERRMQELENKLKD